MDAPDPAAPQRAAGPQRPSLAAGLLLGAAAGALFGIAAGPLLLWAAVGGCLGLLLVLVLTDRR